MYTLVASDCMDTVRNQNKRTEYFILEGLENYGKSM